MTRRTISYVTAGFPFPLSTGYLRHHHLLRELSPDHAVRLRCLAGPGFEEAHRDGVSDLVEEVSVFPTGRQSRLGRRAHQLAPDLRPSVRRLRAQVAADVADGVEAVLLSGKDTVSVLDVVPPDLPLVVDLCDATSARCTQELRDASLGRRTAILLRRQTLRRAERDLIERGDVLLTASARDRELLRDEGAPPDVDDAVVLPNGIDAGWWDRRTSHLGESVVLCGNLGYRPNAEAARRLVREVMPGVWARRPHTQVVIVGTGASPALESELRGPQVTLTGTVDDVRPHLEDAAVVAVPLLAATGIQNKLLEALALQIPVVTTSVAAAGLGPDAPLTVTDTADGLASAVLDRLESGVRCPDAEAREWVRERFSWEHSGHLLSQAIAAAVEREPVSC